MENSFDYGNEHSLVLLPRALRVPEQGSFFVDPALKTLTAFRMQQEDLREVELVSKTGVLPMIFSRLDSLDGVRRFAENFGFLYSDLSAPLAAPGRMREESAEDWLEDAGKMRAAVELLESVRTDDKPEDWAALSQLINGQLGQYVQISLVSDPAGTQLTRNPPRLVVKPVNLLGALWLLFAEIVAGSLKAGKCPKCSKWFWGNKKGAIARGKTFCSESCRKLFRYHEKKGSKDHE